MFNLKAPFYLILCLLIPIDPLFSESPPCEVVSYITSCEIKENKLTEIDTIVIQIKNRIGERYTNISIPYSKNQKISELKAWIEDGYGRIVRKLKNSDVIDKSSISDFSLYEDDFIKTFSLKHNEYPYRIVYTYKISFKQFINIQWNPIVHYKIPTQNAKFTLKVPKGYGFQKYSNNIPSPKVQDVNNELFYTWEAAYLNPVQKELFAVPLDEILPSLTINPNNFKYGVEGTSKNWATFGNWLCRLIQGLDELPDDDKSRVSELIKGVKDKKEIVKLLYHYLQDNTRYINVSIGIGGLKPYPASYVAINKYGDCKALTIYMKALLNFAGIKSNYTVIYGGLNAPKIMDQIPGLQYFNHAVLMVPLNNDTIWLENTSSSNPFAYVGSFIQNRRALMIDESNSKLIRIPTQAECDVLVSRKVDITFNRAGDASVNIIASLKGVEFEEFNDFNLHVNDDQKDKSIREYLTYSNFDLVKWELNRFGRDSSNIKLKLNMNFYKVLKSLGTESYFTIIPTDIPNFELPKDRKLAVQVPYPIIKRDTLVYEMPEGYELKSTPDNVMVSTTFGKYSLSFKNSGSILTIAKELKMYPQECALSQYSDFYKFTSMAKEADKAKIILRKK